MLIVLQLIILILLLYLSFLLIYSLLRGAPYAAISNTKIQIMLSLLKAKRGKFIDIGAGDGRIVIQAARKGLEAYGIEINPFLAVVSKNNIRKNKIKNAHIILGDCWKHDFSTYDYVSIWGTGHMMKMIEKKLLKELKPGAKVVSNHFQFPHWKEVKKKEDVYLYVKT